MHIDRHSHHAKTAYALLVLTIAFVGYLFYTFPDLRQHYIAPLRYFIATTTRTTDISVQNTQDAMHTATSAAITEFGSTSDFVLIDENTLDTSSSSTASTSEELLPSTIEGFTPSPESQWASVYLSILDTNFDILDLNIQYVRNWQQTGGFMRDLKEGSKGQDVTLMQYLLHKFEPSFSAKSITGSFGPKTKTALMALQKRLQLKPTGVFNDETRFFFDAVYFKELCPDADPEQDKTYENVGRRISVPLDYIPSDLIRLPRTVRSVGVMCLSKEPAKRLEDMFAAAKTEGHELAVFSAYRSSKTQKLLTQYYLSSLGKAGLAGVAEAGHSEHQLGTTVDISGKSIGYAGPSQKFGIAPEGKWLENNSYKYGFILSYPQGKQADTGYIYEPWHFRYVGIDTARDIFEEKLTIQEYFNLVKGEGYSLEMEPEI
jgi:D-alanyl-D-alanine carboxypeptidase